MTASEDRLHYVLDNVHQWIRAVDAKAGAVLTIAALALGWLVEDAPNLLASVGGVAFGCAVLTLATGMALAAAALFPILAITDKPWSPLFFGDIAARHGAKRDLAAAAEAYVADCGGDATKLFSEQIMVNSIIATRKYKNLKRAFAATMLGFFVVLVLKLFASTV